MKYLRELKEAHDNKIFYLSTEKEHDKILEQLLQWSVRLISQNSSIQVNNCKNEWSRKNSWKGPGYYYLFIYEWGSGKYPADLDLKYQGNQIPLEEAFPEVFKASKAEKISDNSLVSNYKQQLLSD